MSRRTDENFVDYAKGWRDSERATRPPSILNAEDADELLQRCEKSYLSGPHNTRVDILVPPEILHELLVVWKVSRTK